MAEHNKNTNNHTQGLKYSEIATQADFSGHTKRASGLSDENMNLNLLENTALIHHHQLMHFVQGVSTPSKNIKVIPYGHNTKNPDINPM